MLHVRAKAIRWVSDLPQPGLVEVSLTDAHGIERRFVDKWPIFTADNLTSNTSYPVDVSIDCDAVARTTDSSGHEIVVVSTAMPWGVVTVDGVDQFEVAADQLVAR